MSRRFEKKVLFSRRFDKKQRKCDEITMKLRWNYDEITMKLRWSIPIPTGNRSVSLEIDRFRVKSIEIGRFRSKSVDFERNRIDFAQNRSISIDSPRDSGRFQGKYLENDLWATWGRFPAQAFWEVGFKGFPLKPSGSVRNLSGQLPGSSPRNRPEALRTAAWKLSAQHADFTHFFREVGAIFSPILRTFFRKVWANFPPTFSIFFRKVGGKNDPFWTAISLLPMVP